MRMENRAGTPVLVFDDGSCRPAQDVEVTLWAQCDRYRDALARALVEVEPERRAGEKCRR